MIRNGCRNCILENKKRERICTGTENKIIKWDLCLIFLHEAVKMLRKTDESEGEL